MEKQKFVVFACMNLCLKIIPVFVFFSGLFLGNFSFLFLYFVCFRKSIYMAALALSWLHDVYAAYCMFYLTFDCIVCLFSKKK